MPRKGELIDVPGRRILAQYRRNCRRSNTYFGLSCDEFYALIALPCYYCGRPPSNRDRDFRYSGIDRMNNKQGYYAANCVPACKECNGLKSDRLTPGETLAAVAAIRAYRNKIK